MAKILIIDDDPRLTALLKALLEKQRYVVESAHTCANGLEKLGFSQYDLIILDLMLPDGNGVEICKQYRAGGGTTPVLMLTAMSASQNLETGLDAGADDYLTKPFKESELAARVRALLRRAPAIADFQIRCREIVLDINARKVTRGGQEIHLLPREFTLLEFFMRHPNVVFSTDTLIKRVWSSDSGVLADTVRGHIKELRKKIDREGEPSHIHTVHGVGYKFEIS